MPKDDPIFPLPHVIADPNDWPITKLSSDSKAFLSEVVRLSENNIFGKAETKEELNKMIERVLYQERIRLTQSPWKADKPDEKDFWSRVKKDLLNATAETATIEDSKAIIHRIIVRYSDEILGNFNPSTYRFAKKVVPFIFRRLLNASPENKWKFWSKKKRLSEKIKITGDLDTVRALSKKGTIVMVPTHFSNLDSPLIGFVIESIGLPAFVYGAGLNLFAIKLLSYFMRNLGAYKVDRRKKNLFYLETLKNYSTAAIQRGAHSLFFPGGTRSRSGHLEDKLKLGLLGTAVEAQRTILQSYNEDTARKIFILPAVINYHFVLEASGLIKQHLKRTGKERFLAENDEYSTSYKMIKFMLQFVSKSQSSATISLAPVMDVFGNKVDAEGNSYNHLGKKVNIKDYFSLDGAFKEDLQREKEYTRMLEREIVKSYKTSNTVLSSHLVAFVAFQTIVKKYKELDLYAILRLPSEDTYFTADEFKENLQIVINRLQEMDTNGEIQLSEKISDEIKNLIAHGLRNMSIYHTVPPLEFDNKGNYFSKDLSLLYYYHNRLEGYKLDTYVK